MTNVDIFDSLTSLFTHACACCGDPIAARHEAICEDIIAIDKLEHGSDVNGEFTTIYCSACFVEVLELNEIATWSDISALLDH
ncbi:MAG TPA: hypothetical protein VKM55_29910 [Candidatus Lokiarchaeia archaeon]|nr:hypothetical protein [Candidatus Lokiarchaeia archaeon]